jgi:Holliday junction resolvase RusA-like endonuclease
MHLTLTGSVPSKKNSRITTHTGRSFPNKKYTDWEKDVLQQLQLQRWTPFTEPISLALVFYVKDRVGRDLDNMCSSVLDVLKDYKKKKIILRKGVVRDDSWKDINPISLVVAGVDKTNPRVEIYLDEPAPDVAPHK